MIRYRFGLGFIASLLSTASPVSAKDWYDNSSVHIPQVVNSAKPVEKVSEKEKDVLFNEENLLANQKMDYQADIINNPRYTDYGRAQAAIKENEAAMVAGSGVNSVEIKQDRVEKKLSEDQLGKNVVVIHQEGASNSSKVVQSGDHNVAVQTQKGEKNDLSVTQTGKHNESYEEQIGKYNHKKKVQNGVVTESD